MEIEYKVRPVTRFIVTRYHHYDDGKGRCGGGVDTCGEFENENQAGWVAGALAQSEGAKVDPRWARPPNAPNLVSADTEFESGINPR